MLHFKLLIVAQAQRVKRLENSGAYLRAAGVICLTSPIRLARRFRKWTPPRIIASKVIVPILESEFRRKLQPIEKLVERSGIREEMIVVELGCGPGVHTIDFARAVGKEGKLYAVDVRQEIVDRLERKLEQPEYEDINNIETKVASAYELPFSDESIDLVVMVCVLSEIRDKGKALKEIHRILKPNGILAISENLVDPDYPLRKTTKKHCVQAGYKLVKASGNFWNYTLRFRKV